MSKLADSVTGFLLRNRMNSPLVTLAKSEMALGFVTVVKNIRYVALGIFALTALTAMIAVGGILFIAGLLSVMSVTAHTMGVLALILGALFLALAGVVFALIYSEKFWVKVCKIDDVVERVAGPETQASTSTRPPISGTPAPAT